MSLKTETKTSKNSKTSKTSKIKTIKTRKTTKIKSVQPKYSRKIRQTPRKTGSVGKYKYLTQAIKRNMESAMDEYKMKNVIIKDVCSAKGSSYDTEISKYDLIKKIGEGAYGKVYIADTKNKKNELVIKVQKLTSPSNFDSFLEEANLTKKLYSEYKIGPRFHNAWYCMETNTGPGTGYIVAEKMDGDLKSLQTDDQTSFKDNVYLDKRAYDDFKRNLEVLHKNGYVHADLMPKNVLVNTITKNNKTIIKKMIMTDFGLTDKKELFKYDINWLMTLFTYTKKYYPDTMTDRFSTVKENPTLLDIQLIKFIDKKLPIY